MQHSGERNTIQVSSSQGDYLQILSSSERRDACRRAVSAEGPLVIRLALVPTAAALLTPATGGEGYLCSVRRTLPTRDRFRKAFSFEG